jgi:hypothetical protein
MRGPEKDATPLKIWENCRRNAAVLPGRITVTYEFAETSSYDNVKMISVSVARGDRRRHSQWQDHKRSPQCTERSQRISLLSFWSLRRSWQRAKQDGPERVYVLGWTKNNEEARLRASVNGLTRETHDDGLFVSSPVQYLRRHWAEGEIPYALQLGG